MEIKEVELEKTRTFDMEYFNLTEENIELLSDNVGLKYETNNPGTSIYFDTRAKLEYLGQLLGKELNLDLVKNYTEKPNKQAGRGKGFVLKEYILAGFIPKKHEEKTGRNLFLKLSFWGFDTRNPYFGVDIDVNFSDNQNHFIRLRDTFQKQKWQIPLKEFPNNWINLIEMVKPHSQTMLARIDTYLQQIEISKEMIQYINLLEANKNLILTGAPGTGKTYLARKIAQELTNDNKEIEFVQFHPSYDYTDFVEGLRPIKKEGNDLGFELQDGVFKLFCKKAIENLINSNKTEEELSKENIAHKNISDFLDLCIEEGIELELSNGNKFTIIEYNASVIKINVPNNLITSNVLVPINELYPLFINQEKLDKVKEVRTFFNRTYNRQTDSYVFAIYNDKRLNKEFNTGTGVTRVERKKYVIIIDEINRAEISKVFGELFFSIDPGYRGEEGRVKTQYANLQDPNDLFYDGFYVPENVYIIGTMNDIDRSVESMDFAMRRRFAWKEVTAEERVNMWDGQIDDWKDEAFTRLKALNDKIQEIQGLNSAYHIGPAYFLKLEKYKEEKEPFEHLWNNHIKGVIFEYLRGLPNASEILNNLKFTYELQEG